jgi:hypothetical protein
MFSRSYSNGNTCVFLKNDVEIDGKIYKIEAGKYGLSGRKIRMIYPSSLRHSVEKYVFDDDVEKVVELIVDAYRLMYAEDLKGCPGVRFLVVRICSALGCGVKESLRDIFPSNDKSKHEFLFYGIIIPSLSIDVSGCVYYRMWADEVKWRSSGSSNCLVGYKWKNWNERWEEYWWKENKGFNKGLVKCGRGR